LRQTDKQNTILFLEVPQNLVMRITFERSIKLLADLYETYLILLVGLFIIDQRRKSLINFFFIIFCTLWSQVTLVWLFYLFFYFPSFLHFIRR